MRDTIYREDAIKALEELSACEDYGVEIGTDEETYIGKYEAITEISDLPSARPKEGKWIWNENGMDWGIGCWCCSECGMRNPYIGNGDTALLSNPHNWAGSKYCPNCGADMRGVDDGNK